MPDLQALLDQIDQIDQLDQQATQAPWTATGDVYGGKVYEPSGYPLPGCTSCGENEATYEGRDAEFIALARTALPQLAAVIRRLRECAQNLTEDNNDASDYASGIHEAVECLEHIIKDALGDDNA